MILSLLRLSIAEWLTLRRISREDLELVDVEVLPGDGLVTSKYGDGCESEKFCIFETGFWLEGKICCCIAFGGNARWCELDDEKDVLLWYWQCWRQWWWNEEEELVEEEEVVEGIKEEKDAGNGVANDEEEEVEEEEEDEEDKDEVDDDDDMIGE